MPTTQSVQIVGYDTGTSSSSAKDGNSPALRVSDGDTVERMPVEPGNRLSYALGKRHCAGTVDGTGHVPCDDLDAPYCDAHTDTWVCARCTGTCLKDEMDCYEEHAVYIAAFAPDTFKVGVTREWRLQTRLEEQGADRAAHIHTVSNGRIARELESEIAQDITDRVRVPRKIRNLHRSVDEEAWTDLLSEFTVIETFTFDDGLGLSSRPVDETLASGTVVGTKGRVLVLENGGTTYGVDMRDLVGHDVTTETPDRDLQSSLGAFG